MLKELIYSKKFADLYSFSHASWGIILFFIVDYLDIDFYNGLYIIICVKIIFEVLENTEFIIRRYRKHYDKYYGDSFINIVGDILFGVLGYLFAYYFRALAVIYLIVIQIILNKYNADIFSLTLGIIF
tara:strand:+ start:488 stop:871 length:384 start_codon:yes stop_codon:yes gene_type:complete